MSRPVLAVSPETFKKVESGQHVLIPEDARYRFTGHTECLVVSGPEGVVCETDGRWAWPSLRKGIARA